ncbi:MAG: DUF2497 domain-containing protein [Rhizobiaceae bacterium]|nr:DUF2497 domain-containing protein [Rhizobiaceae bacterium]
MAQASSVPAREPSMEEILASIRRIIEDSDHAVPAGNDAGQPANEDSAFTQPDDVGGAINEADNPEADAEAGASDINAFRTELTEPEPARDVSDSLQHDFTPPVAPAVEPPVQDYSPPEESPVGQQFEPAASQPQQRNSIISETAERQVAAAFEELSDAFASSQKRSFDEIAEELMRPMLQDWLDNNLPVLVERLVREEIERVARGAAR